jgi:hypothetical protein
MSAGWAAFWIMTEYVYSLLFVVEMGRLWFPQYTAQTFKGAPHSHLYNKT